MQSDTPATTPPEGKRDKEFHWLVSERAWSPVPAQWIKSQWYSPGEGTPISPEEMYRRGWRWGAVAKPPRELRA